MPSNKLLQIANLDQIRNDLPEKKIILVSGCFDVIHAGHVRFLLEAKNKADLLVVGILADTFVKKRKGTKRPVFSAKERVELLSHLTMVDYLFVFDSNEVEELLTKLKPDFYGVGGDRKENQLPEIKLLKKYEVKAVFLSRFGNNSTSKILAKVFTNP